MRVLQIPEWYPSEERPYLGVFNREIAQAVSLENVSDVLIIHIDRNSSFGSVSTHVQERKGVREIQMSIGGSSIPGFTRFVIQRLYNKALKYYISEYGRPDVIHSQDLIAYFMVRSRVVEAHNIPVLVSQHWTAFLRKALSKEQVQRFKVIFDKAAYILPAMKDAEQGYKEYGLNGRVAWLPNVLDTDVFFNRELARENCILHISGFTDQKRVGDIIKAFAKLTELSKDVKLVLIGEGTQRSYYEEMASKLLPIGTYEFTGFQNREEVASWLNRAKCFVFPSTFETFGCVLMEAAACGCPILSTRVGGIVHVLEDSQAYFVPPKDIEALYQGMKEIVIDELYQSDINEVAEAVTAKFSKEVIGDQLSKLYSKALEDSK